MLTKKLWFQALDAEDGYRLPGQRQHGPELGVSLGDTKSKPPHRKCLVQSHRAASGDQGTPTCGTGTTSSELRRAMGADIHPLAELCGVFSSWEERRAQETQFSPRFHRNRQR